MARRVAAVAGGVVALVLWFSVTGWALTLNEGLTANQLNTIEDQDRDSYIDVDGSGTFSVGDVLTGFVRFDDFLPETPPGGGPVNEQVYAVFSQQVTSITTQLVGTADAFATIGFGPTITPGLTLTDLTGDPLDGVMFAVYDTAGSFGNLVETAPGTSMLDYIEFIAAGDLRLGITLGPAPDYFTALIGTSAFPAGADLVNSGFSNAGIPSLPTSSQIGAFSGGLSVVVNNTIFDYAPLVVSSNLTLHQVAVSNGAIRGQVGDVNAAFFTPSGVAGFPQCTVGPADEPCGFVTDADFFVFPTQVPAPGSLMLLGLGLVSAVAAGLSRRRQRP